MTSLLGRLQLDVEFEKQRIELDNIMSLYDKYGNTQEADINFSSSDLISAENTYQSTERFFDAILKNQLRI